MSHALDQDELRARNRLGRRSPAADVAHTVRQAVDHEGGDI